MAVAESLASGLKACGIASEKISIFDDEASAARAAIDETADGDLLLLLSHEDFDGLLAMAQKA